MKHLPHIKIGFAALCLGLLVGCAPAVHIAEPGGQVGPTDKAAVVGFWTYDVTGSCFLLRGTLLIIEDRGGLSVRLTEQPVTAGQNPDTMQRLRDQQRCNGVRAMPVTIAMDEVSFDGTMLVFRAASRWKTARWAGR